MGNKRKANIRKRKKAKAEKEKRDLQKEILRTVDVPTPKKMKKKVTFTKMGTKKITRRKNSNTLTQKERNDKKQKAIKEFQAWFK